MPVDLSQKGLANIRDAINAALAEHNIKNATIGQSVQPSGDVVFTLSVAGEQTEKHFTHEEIDDSGQAIDHNAAMKVRHLVSHYVR